MKSFKLFITLACSLFCVGLLYGHTVRVDVVSGRERLAYAYVYINGEAAGVADTLGVFIVPPEKLRRGDTLSASFVGFEGGAAIYDGNASQI